MLAKFLIALSLIFTPFVFTGEQVYQPLPVESLSESGEVAQENAAYLSSISSLWLTNPNFLPVRNWEVDDPEIEAAAVLISNIAESSSLSSKNKILYQKNIDTPLPIASLTKLMAAIIVLDNINLGEEVVISENAVNAYGARGGLVVNEKITVRNLLYALLIESSNDAAVALAEAVQTSAGMNFVDLMNKKAEELELKNTHFADPSGYLPDNISTARDLARLAKYIFNYPLILEISKTPNINLTSVDGAVKHYLSNTNELLKDLPDIVGGKTGYTQEARGCFVLITRQSEKDYLVTIILGAQERFLEAQKLIEWVKRAYRWE